MSMPAPWSAALRCLTFCYCYCCSAAGTSGSRSGPAEQAGVLVEFSTDTCNYSAFGSSNILLDGLLDLLMIREFCAKTGQTPVFLRSNHSWTVKATFVSGSCALYNRQSAKPAKNLEPAATLFYKAAGFPNSIKTAANAGINLVTRHAFFCWTAAVLDLAAG
jgi:hypothetical protein